MLRHSWVDVNHNQTKLSPRHTQRSRSQTASTQTAPSPNLSTLTWSTVPPIKWASPVWPGAKISLLFSARPHLAEILGVLGQGISNRPPPSGNENRVSQVRRMQHPGPKRAELQVDSRPCPPTGATQRRHRQRQKPRLATRATFGASSEFDNREPVQPREVGHWAEAVKFDGRGNELGAESMIATSACWCGTVSYISALRAFPQSARLHGLL